MSRHFHKAPIVGHQFKLNSLGKSKNESSIIIAFLWLEQYRHNGLFHCLGAFDLALEWKTAKLWLLIIQEFDFLSCNCRYYSPFVRLQCVSRQQIRWEGAFSILYSPLLGNTSSCKLRMPNWNRFSDPFTTAAGVEAGCFRFVLLWRHESSADGNGPSFLGLGVDKQQRFFLEAYQLFVSEIFLMEIFLNWRFEILDSDLGIF